MIAILLGLFLFLPNVGHASQAEAYIAKASGRLKVGTHQGRNLQGQFCSVQVRLENLGKGRRYTVEISPSVNTYAAPEGPTVISFSSGDARVLFDDGAIRAVSNRGDDYHVLGIENTKAQKLFIRAYVKTGNTLKVGECTI